MIRRRKIGRRTEVRLVLEYDQQKIMRDAAIVARAAELQLAHEGVEVPAEVADALSQLRIRGTNKGTPRTKQPDSRSESGLDEIWCRIPDSARSDPHVPRWVPLGESDRCGTHGTADRRVQIRAQDRRVAD